MLWLWLMLASLAMPLQAARAADDFLPPEQAFVFSATMASPNTLRIDYQVARGYYMYRERFAFAVQPEGAVTLGEAVFPPGEVKYDPTFEKNMEVYHRPLSIQLPLGPGAGTFTLAVTGQGCADKGVCYPPMTHTVALRAVAGGYQIAGTQPGGFSAAPSSGTGLGLTSASGSAALASSAGPGSASAAPGATTSGGLAALARSDDVGLAGAIAGMGLLKTAAVFLVLGVLLSLTPCVLPMIPILSSLVVGGHAHGGPSRRRGLGLAAAYVLGMSIIYTALGVAAGLSGAGLAAWLQTPWILMLFAALLAALSLAMFDVYTFQAPAWLQSGLSARAGRIPGGRATGAFLMGAVSALIVGPCVAAPLAGALLYISQTGDVMLGAVALFVMAWGMGVPLLVVGASAGSVLPRAGAWMDGVKRLFGMLLLGTAWWMLIPLLPVWVQMVGWGFLAIVGAVMLRAFEALPAGGGAGRMFAKGLGLLLALVAVIWVVGAASGGRDVWRPLSHLAQGDARYVVAGASGLPASAGAGPALAGARGDIPAATAHGLAFAPVRSVAELDAMLANADRPVLLDFYADWCVSCREMEQFTFTDPAVAARMSGMLLLRADVTANNADDRALLKRFRLFGPPGIMFFSAGGRELSDIRVIGFQDAGRFVESLDRVARASPAGDGGPK
ncbi:protein-disulfide reductase DsbD [Bordetella flabilis]|uniref:Thiol:disulfide interchange protein DsbD n=2 Tax=Bordetella flabilis TaxID=463014 RepID=A0A193GKT6_9BORD|nr:protein-disulfide reductase [Bordetella flabilis]